MSDTLALDAAADALLRILVKAAREHAAAHPPRPIRATPFEWRDPTAIPTRDALDLRGLVSDPVGTACRAELRRIGRALHAANPGEDFTALTVEVAEMDPTHAGWRAIVLETAWAGIGCAAADPPVRVVVCGLNETYARVSAALDGIQQGNASR